MMIETKLTESTTTSSARPRRAATEQRRREILDAALQCFLESGVHETSMEQIRKVAGASTGSIYHLFTSKDEIALTLFIEGMRQFHNRVLTAVAAKRSARGMIRAIISTHLEITVQEPKSSLYLTQMSMAHEVGPIADEFRGTNDRYAQEIAQHLAPFIETGELVQLPSELYFSLIVGPAAHVCRSWLRGRYTGDPRAVTDILAVAAWKSLCPLPRQSGNNAAGGPWDSFKTDPEWDRSRECSPS